MAVPLKLSLTNSRLQDRAVEEINVRLISRLSWLDRAYGAAVKKPIEKPAKNISRSGLYPAFETNSNDSRNYYSLFPNQDLGVFCFWDIEDGIEVTSQSGFITSKFKAGLVFWGDLRKVYGAVDWKGKNTATVLWESLEALRKRRFQGVELKFNKCYFESLNIYRGYDYSEIENQHLMRPFFGFRINCEITHKEICT